MIDLDAESLATVKRILAEHVPGCEVRAFGSRVEGSARKFSDLDLALVTHERLDRRQVEALKDAFAESDLPFQVDVLDWHAVSATFKKVIDRRFETVQA